MIATVSSDNIYMLQVMYVLSLAELCDIPLPLLRLVTIPRLLRL